MPEQYKDIREVPEDLVIPVVSEGEPAAGLRVRQSLDEWNGTEVYHLLYLPEDWQEDKKYPLIVEYAGNGPYEDEYGDTSDGTVEGSKLGYGISGGKKFIWLCLPYVNVEEKRNQTQWWADADATADYCVHAVELVCAKYGADPEAILLTGFSRGAIACHYIGLRNDRIAKLWRAFVTFSHYDGVRENWGYEQADRVSALERLHRLNGRPQFICSEGDGARDTEQYLAQTGVQGDFTFTSTGFRNHNDAWILRDSPTRKMLRDWVRNVLNIKDDK